MQTNTYTWYQELIKPDWAPPVWLFGYVWSVLYLIIAVSFGYVLYLYITSQGKSAALPFLVLLPFLLNIFFNLIFTPIQFGLRSNLLASLDIVLVLVTILWFMTAIFPYARWVALVNIPYLLWVCIATVLQFSITYLNWK